MNHKQWSSLFAHPTQEALRMRVGRNGEGLGLHDARAAVPETEAAALCEPLEAARSGLVCGHREDETPT